VPTSGCGKASAGSGNFTIDVAGTPRTYIVKIPTTYDMNRPYRLIFAWHGKSGSAAQTASGGYYRLETPSAGSAIFVAGDGFTPDEGWPNTNGRDVAFAKALVEWMRSNYCVDNNRIFSVGMSYGGIMSNTLGCQMGDVFRAITPMSGSGPRLNGGIVCVGRPAAWLSHGTADDTVSFASGQASRDHWREVNHCTATADPVAPDPCVSYQGCDPGYPVHWCEFDGGHTVPSFAAAGIWPFLAQF
jgi:poly(3-hydroxybutyrate) depolymerase